MSDHGRDVVGLCLRRNPSARPDAAMLRQHPFCSGTALPPPPCPSSPVRPSDHWLSIIEPKIAPLLSYFIVSVACIRCMYPLHVSLAEPYDGSDHVHRSSSQRSRNQSQGQGERDGSHQGSRESSSARDDANQRSKGSRRRSKGSEGSAGLRSGLEHGESKEWSASSSGSDRDADVGAAATLL